jgi:hypothetical protein
MKHLTEEELVAYFYKDSPQPEHVANHLRSAATVLTRMPHFAAASRYSR